MEESLQLNDKLQSLLAKHDAIASGSALPLPTEKEDPPSAPVLTTPVAVASTSQVTDLVANEEEEEEDDEFAQLARRYATSTVYTMLFDGVLLVRCN